MFTQKKFSNGLRLIVSPVPSTKAVTVLVLVGAGSRYESQRERGIAHFLEHMFFKGGERFSTPREVSETIDTIGGDFNAYTGKEYAGYYIKCASEKKEVAFDVLGDMLLNTKLDENDIARERGVILEELNMYEDTPMYQIGWDFEKLLFGDTPMGRDQIGLPENIRSFSPDDFRAYRADLYTPDNTVLIVSGDISFAEAEALTKTFFPFPITKKNRTAEQVAEFSEEKYIEIRTKKTEQAHLVIGFPGLPFGHADEFAVRLLAILLGGNMSSRMFLHVREKLGLCYSISTSTDHYSDVGVISTHAGVDVSRVPEAITAIMHEYRSMAECGVEEKELEKAKSYLKGKLVLRMEDSEEIASFLGVQAMLRGEIFPLETLFEKIERVSSADIVRVARDIFLSHLPRLALIGSFAGKEEEFLHLLHKKN